MLTPSKERYKCIRMMFYTFIFISVCKCVAGFPDWTHIVQAALPNGRVNKKVSVATAEGCGKMVQLVFELKSIQQAEVQGSAAARTLLPQLLPLICSIYTLLSLKPSILSPSLSSMFYQDPCWNDGLCFLFFLWFFWFQLGAFLLLWSHLICHLHTDLIIFAN